MLREHQEQRLHVKEVLRYFFSKELDAEQVALEFGFEESIDSLRLLLETRYPTRFDGSPYQGHPISAAYIGRALIEGTEVPSIDSVVLLHDHFEEIYLCTSSLLDALAEFKIGEQPYVDGVLDSLIMTEANVASRGRIGEKVHKIIQIENLGDTRHKIAALADRMDNCSDMDFASERKRSESLIKFFLAPLMLELEVYTDIPSDVKDKARLFMEELVEAHCLVEGEIKREFQEYSNTRDQTQRIVTERVQQYRDILECTFPAFSMKVRAA